MGEEGHQLGWMDFRSRSARVAPVWGDKIMPRWLRITLTLVVLLLVVGGGAYWWFIADGNPPANVEPYGFDLAAVRARGPMPIRWSCPPTRC